VHTGEIFCLLGPNGAGKSTTISMLSCLLPPSGGDAWVFGHSITTEPMAVKATIGVVPQEIAIYDDMSARDNLVFWGRMAGLGGRRLRQRVECVLETTGLIDRQRGQAGQFSGGMKRRLNIGIALLHQPRLVIMDEPTVGIDPQSRRRILDGVKELNGQGTTVLYTTHYMEEAAELADHIAIVDQGQVIAYGTHAELVRIVGQKDRLTLDLSHRADALYDAWHGLAGVASVSTENGRATLLVDDSNRTLPTLFETAGQAGVRITSVEIQEPNLESVFLHLTGRALRDG